MELQLFVKLEKYQNPPPRKYYYNMAFPGWLIYPGLWSGLYNVYKPVKFRMKWPAKKRPNVEIVVSELCYCSIIIHTLLSPHPVTVNLDPSAHSFSVHKEIGAAYSFISITPANYE